MGANPTPAARLRAQIAKAEALAAKAIPGEWEVVPDYEFEDSYWVETDYDGGHPVCGGSKKDSLEFIAASRTLVPQMAAAVMTLVEARDEMYRQNNLISALIIFDDALTTAAAAMGDGDE